jgi:hypothetical protein
MEPKDSKLIVPNPVAGLDPEHLHPIWIIKDFGIFLF